MSAVLCHDLLLQLEQSWAPQPCVHEVQEWWWVCSTHCVPETYYYDWLAAHSQARAAVGSPRLSWDYSCKRCCLATSCNDDHAVLRSSFSLLLLMAASRPHSCLSGELGRSSAPVSVSSPLTLHSNEMADLHLFNHSSAPSFV